MYFEKMIKEEQKIWQQQKNSLMRLYQLKLE
jgi:hypothetical protein